MPRRFKYKLTILLFLIVSIPNTSCKLLADEEFAEAGIYQFSAKNVLNILMETDYLSLHLRNANETSNPFVEFLMNQNVRAIQLTVGEKADFTASQRHRALTVASAEDLAGVVSNYGNRAGRLFCILLQDVLIDDRMMNIASKVWHQQGLYKVYYIDKERIFFYNPFALKPDGKYGAFVDPNIMPMRDIVKNLNGYSVRVYIFDSVYSNILGDPELERVTDAEGADSEVAKLLSKNLNFTMQLQWPDDEFFGAHLTNGSYDGAIGRILRSETDISMTGFFIKDYLTRDIEFTVSVYMDELCCYVMKAKQIPSSIVPIFAVKGDMWCGFLLAGLLCAFIWIGIRRLNLKLHSNLLIPRGHKLKSNFQYIRIFIDTWVVWVRVNISHFPPFDSERIFVLSLCLISVIFGALFESSLATVYIHPLYYNDINTLQELNDANFRIYIKHAAMKDDLFTGQDSQLFKNLNRKILLVTETEDRLINMMSKRGGFSAVTRASALQLNDILYFITKQIHKIPECPKNYHIAYLMPKQSPYGKKINELLLLYLQAGLIEHYIEKTKHRAKLTIYNFRSYMEKMGKSWKVLTLNDLQLAFYIFTLGCILATVAWFLEMLINTKFSKDMQKLVNFGKL